MAPRSDQSHEPRWGSFDRFYAAEYKPMLRLAYGLTGSGPAAVQIVQDTMSNVAKQWSRVGNYDRPDAWARRVLLERATAAAERPRPSDGAPPSEIVTALQGMPNLDAHACALYYFEGMAATEIANVLEQPDGTALLDRARTALARELGEQDEGGRDDARMRTYADDVARFVADFDVPSAPEPSSRRARVTIAVLAVAAAVTVAAAGAITLAQDHRDNPTGATSVSGQTTLLVLGDGMAPALRRNDQVPMRPVTAEDVTRGDIVSFVATPEILPDNADVITQRIVGLPGETVESRDGVVYVDGQPLPEPYLPDGTTTSDFGPETVPLDHFWTLGDNRSEAIDAREFGPTPFADIRFLVLLDRTTTPVE